MYEANLRVIIDALSLAWEAVPERAPDLAAVLRATAVMRRAAAEAGRLLGECPPALRVSLEFGLGQIRYWIGRVEEGARQGLCPVGEMAELGRHVQDDLDLLRVGSVEAAERRRGWWPEPSTE